VFPLKNIDVDNEGGGTALGIKQVGSIQRTRYTFEGIAAPLVTTTFAAANIVSGIALYTISVEQGTL
jgi:hypothetical protein